jgi:hypothetical protein
MRRLLPILLGLAAAVIPLASAGPALADDAASSFGCDEGSPLCTDTFLHQSTEGYYIGHDEPAVAFLDSRHGSGYDVTYRIRLPKEPATQPTQDGTNGYTWSFEQRVAFWYSMVLCDTESAPEYTHSCEPDTDHNIFTSTDPSSPRYMGKAPGSAFLELQFYPPGWVPQFTGFDCPGLKWCVNLTIDSFNVDLNNGINNNAACLGSVGPEPVNWAYLTFDGHPHAPPDPISLVTNPATGNPDPTTDLQPNPGDLLTLHIFDTLEGLRVEVTDRTTGQTGSMTASAANGFQQVIFDPSSSTCTERPYTFHPMFASSTKRTRTSWAAHTFNVGASDEIGHFEWCDQVNPDLTCASSPTAGDPDADDFPCFPASFSSLVQVSGCVALAGDLDFDGPAYQPASWPGGTSGAFHDRFTPDPWQFTSPTFAGGQNFRHVAFESDTPAIESTNAGGTCNTQTGEGCFAVPAPANFYPFYTTARDVNGHCVWQLGGGNISGTTNDFGGTAESAWGSLNPQPYIFPGGTQIRYETFRNDLIGNPCSY